MNNSNTTNILNCKTQSLLHKLSHCWNRFLDFIEMLVMWFIIWLVKYLPVKEIRDDKGEPFLHRYHLFSFTNNGPGICIHHFLKSDPDRGFHDHPWSGCSFILSNFYDERILNVDDIEEKNYSKHTFDMSDYSVFRRKRFTFNSFKGKNKFHRVMVNEEATPWTLFFFGKRSKNWNMIGLDGKHRKMSVQVKDTDGGWWNHAQPGHSLIEHSDDIGNVSACVDIIVRCGFEILLIKRKKDPYKDCWAFPGGRVNQTDKSLIYAAIRELDEETNIDLINLEKNNIKIVDYFMKYENADLTSDLNLENNPHIKYITTVGNNIRDPRGFTTSHVFMVDFEDYPTNVKAGSDANSYEWFHIDNLPDMAFDHKAILKDALHMKIL